MSKVVVGKTVLSALIGKPICFDIVKNISNVCRQSGELACSVVPPGRAILRRLIDLTIGLSKPHHHRRLNKETRSDIQAWLIFVESFNGKCLFLSDRWGTSEQLNLYTDASNIGFGGLFRKYWFAIKWHTIMG
jgi:hypothetical protein